MGPAVFVLRESTSHSMKQLRAGPPWGGKRASAAGEGTGRETVYSQDGQNPGKVIYKRHKTC